MINCLRHVRRTFSLFSFFVVNDIKRQYLGSVLGSFWALAQPLSLVFVLWFVGLIGIRGGGEGSNLSYLLWLMAGLFPWFSFASGLTGGAVAVSSNAHLVKKVTFNLELLPLVKVASVMSLHVVLLGLLTVLSLMFGSGGWGLLGLFYYSMALACLLISNAFLWSAITVFVKDVGNVLSMMVQLGFWLTPIFWNIERVPEKYRFWLELNPMSYIVSGYRDCIDGTFTIDAIPPHSFGFWLLVTLLGLLGYTLFRKSSPHFGDVL